MKIDIVAVKRDPGLNGTACSAFLFIASSGMCGNQPVDYFGNPVDVEGKTEHIICGSCKHFTPLTSAGFKPFPTLSSRMLYDLDVSNWVLLC